MESELYKSLIEYGGAIVVIVALTFFVDKLGKAWGYRKNTDNGGKQEYINTQVQKQIDNLVEHARVANEEMSNIQINIAEINTKLDILIKYKNGNN